MGRPPVCPTWGGRPDGSDGYLPLDSELDSWARRTGWSLEQAQALVCTEKLGSTKEYRKALKLLKEFHPGAVQRHNKNLPSGHQKKASQLKFYLGPMHLLAHRSYLHSKVRFIPMKP